MSVIADQARRELDVLKASVPVRGEEVDIRIRDNFGIFVGSHFGQTDDAYLLYSKETSLLYKRLEPGKESVWKALCEGIVCVARYPRLTSAKDGTLWIVFNGFLAGHEKVIENIWQKLRADLYEGPKFTKEDRREDLIKCLDNHTYFYVMHISKEGDILLGPTRIDENEIRRDNEGLSEDPFYKPNMRGKSQTPLELVTDSRGNLYLSFLKPSSATPFVSAEAPHGTLIILKADAKGNKKFEKEMHDVSGTVPYNHPMYVDEEDNLHVLWNGQHYYHTIIDSKGNVVQEKKRVADNPSTKTHYYEGAVIGPNNSGNVNVIRLYNVLYAGKPESDYRWDIVPTGLASTVGANSYVLIDRNLDFHCFSYDPSGKLIHLLQ